MIQDTAWSPRFVPSTTATAATSGEAIAGTDTTKFITPSLLPAATSYHAGPVVNGRAPRQGLVFDGTGYSNATLTSQIGTSAATFTAFLKVPSAATAANQYIGYVGASFVNEFDIRIGTSGELDVLLFGSSSSDFNKWSWSSFISSYANKSVHFALVRDTSGNPKIYVNGIDITSSGSFTSGGTPPTWQGTIAGTGSGFGFNYVGVHYGLNIYNRALSASEVVALYEAGAPAGADYNSASNTLLNTSTALNAYSTSFTTFTGASATGFTASDSTASKSPRVIFPLSGTLVAGRRYRAKFTATLTAMSSVNLWQSDSSYAGLGNLGAVSSGSNEFTFTATSSVNAIMLLCTTDGSVGTHSVVISGMAVDTPGLLLAPDAAQAGGGLTWNDTSGNGAHIVLPATGVDFNLPSYGQRIVSAKTSTNGNEKLLGANSLGSVNGRGRDNLVRAYARARTGTPTVTLGWSAGNAGIVASVTLSGGGNGANTWQPLTLITTYNTGVGAAALWAGSNSTDIVDWMIVSDFTPQY